MRVNATLRWRVEVAALLRNVWCALAVLLTSTAAHAGADCNVTATGVDFGLYEPTLPTADDSAGTITVTCVYVAPGATSVSYTVQLSSGMHSATAANRAMGNAAGSLFYNVFRDAAHSQVWGNGLSGTVLASGSMTVGPGVGNRTRTETHTVHGRIPALQDAASGTHTDTLVVTLTY